MSGPENRRRLVLPGDRLCVIEEFLPKSGTRVLPTGDVISTTIGQPEYNHKKHEVSVKSVKNIEKLKIGDIVLCEVQDAQEKLAGCLILAKNGKKLKNEWSCVIIQAPPTLTVGDLVLARIIEEVSGTYTVTINERGLGVVLAYCDKCGSQLRHGRSGLFCSRCRKTYRKKVVPYYGNINKIVDILGLQSIPTSVSSNGG
ncbi:MAG: exosome complex RNA-binding protein Csl4 [Nitrososphaerota archaeon]